MQQAAKKLKSEISKENLTTAKKQENYAVKSMKSHEEISLRSKSMKSHKEISLRFKSMKNENSQGKLCNNKNEVS